MARLAKKVAAINEALAVSVQTPARTVPVLVSANDAEQGDQPKDYWITKNGVKYAGQHLTIDLWDAQGLDDEKRIQQAFLDAIKAAGATLLHIHTHVFEPNGGISGVAVLSESHISCHTWPEKSPDGGSWTARRMVAGMRSRREPSAPTTWSLTRWRWARAAPGRTSCQCPWPAGASGWCRKWKRRRMEIP